MSARFGALIRRWKVWREYRRLINERLDQGYSVTAYQEGRCRAEAERRVP